jgi:hypothetical protein
MVLNTLLPRVNLYFGAKFYKHSSILSRSLLCVGGEIKHIVHFLDRLTNLGRSTSLSLFKEPKLQRWCQLPLISTKDYISKAVSCTKVNIVGPASWSSGQSFWLLIMRSRVRFPVLLGGFFLEGEDPLGDHGLSSSVELRFKAPPGTSYSYEYITIHLIGTT